MLETSAKACRWVRVARPRFIKEQFPPQDVRAFFPLSKDQTSYSFSSAVIQRKHVCCMSLGRKIKDGAVLDRVARAV